MNLSKFMELYSINFLVTEPSYRKMLDSRLVLLDASPAGMTTFLKPWIPAFAGMTGKGVPSSNVAVGLMICLIPMQFYNDLSNMLNPEIKG